MKKQYHDLVQGTPEWHTHRAKCFNASDAPAMLGCSPYKTRDELLKEIATGETKEIDSHLQKIFDNGHKYEKMALPWAEEITGEDLFSPTISIEIEGITLSASYDGIDAFEDVASFEHKTLNEKIKSNIILGTLDKYLRVQMEQQLLIADCPKCLFMASKGNKEEMLHLWYEPDYQLRKEITEGWKQFKIDLDNYQHKEQPATPIAEPVKSLPAVSIKVDGNIALIDNLDVFGKELTEYVGNINATPKTDQDFANLEATVKTLKSAEEALTTAENGALAQAVSIDSMRRTVDLYRSLARKHRLITEKLVKSEKDRRKAEILQEGISSTREHIDQLNKRIGKPYMPEISVNFVAAMKGKRTISSLESARNDELANFKISANSIADKIQINLTSLTEQASEHKFLFSDVSALVQKENDDLISVIKARISDHKQAEENRLKKQREEIRLEEETKARRKIEAEETEKRESEEKEAEGIQVETGKHQKPHKENGKFTQPSDERVAEIEPLGEKPLGKHLPSSTPKKEIHNVAVINQKKTRPSDIKIVNCLSTSFNASNDEVIAWLMDMDHLKVITEVSKLA